MHASRLLKFLLLAASLLLMAWPAPLPAQVEVLFRPIGADTRVEFAHVGLPGAIGIDFRFVGAFAPLYPAEETHTVVVTFEWRASAGDPWSSSPDHVKSVPGAVSTLFDTGVFHGPTDAPLVAIHFFAGDVMTVSGEFSHASVVPEPAQAVLMAFALALLALAHRARVRARGA